MKKRPFSKQHKHVLVGAICFICFFLMTGAYSGARKVAKNGGEQYYVADSLELVQSGDSRTLLQWCIASIGENDNSFVDLWGNGKCTKEEYGDITLRRYHLVLFEQKVDMLTSVEHGRISAITIIPDKGDYTVWFQILRNSFGNPQETIQQKVGLSDDLDASAWNIGEGSIDLRSTYGGVELTLQP
ncbi:hypothetical protein [Anaerosporobacter faecicola]|uniref:hypothetical protein n=1 Tax=Anaerosporobacter faecicola TaxID=2718714 RepID=UPI00143B23A6|nr:hypothetical protein [Anaerosporobacter faecicola]